MACGFGSRAPWCCFGIKDLKDPRYFGLQFRVFRVPKHRAHALQEQVLSEDCSVSLGCAFVSILSVVVPVLLTFWDH